MSSSILISIIITLLIMTSYCQSKNNNVTFDCLPSEKKVLMRLLEASFSDNPYNNRLSSWKANTECCSWEGVECDNATGHVVGLDMSGVDLSGTKDVIKVLDMLSSLVDLRLLGTGLDDTNLPRANCLNRSTLLFTNVQYLDLSSNSLGENSSFCFLHNMTSLSFLDLSSNSLHQKVEWINDFMWDKCHLKSLNLGENQFYGDISVAFRNLSGCWGRNLESINLRENELYGHLPEELGHELKQLTLLDVSKNRLFGPIPSSLGNLRALRLMDLSSNQLGGEIPFSLGQLSNLERIDTSFNNLSGPIPFSLENLRALRVLNLRSNQLGGEIPISLLGQLSNLERIDMYNNSLEGTLSEAHFDKLTKLEYLNIGTNNGIKFKAGDDWVPPFQLHTLSMESIIIEGQFPQWIKTQKSLQDLDLWNCSIGGTLPAWLGSLKNLTSLDLSNNHLEGPIIPELPPSIEWLDLSTNLINGSIPESLCRMKDLNTLDLSRNNLSGHLSDCYWGNLSSLGVAIFSFNQLSGAIPNSIGEGAYQLEWLKLNNNSLTGQLPPSLNNCTGLYVLDLGDNKLSGNIPQWIGNDLSFLGVLRLRNNKFDGDIPSTYCQLSKLQIMDLAHNHLTGSIPRCFGNLSGMISAAGDSFRVIGDSSLSEMMKGAMLEYAYSTSRYLVNLDLSSNRLFGEIPSELTNLIALNGLNLSHNHLRGIIPRRIGDMKSLESFDLSSNSLSGTIPHSLSNLTSLSYLNLSNNDLSGPIPTGPQLQTLNDPSSYDGNHRLCGDPLPQNCGRIIDNGIPLRSRKVENDDDGDTLFFDKIYMYAFITSGLATGFWGYFGVLILKRSWRRALFRRMDVVIAKMLGRY